MKATSFRSISSFLSQKTGINWKYRFQQHGFAFMVAMFLFAILSIYLSHRRGYYDLYIANKVFAGVSAVLLGVVLLIGSGSRFFSFPDRYIRYRKELGIVAFFIAIAHFINSFFFLPSKFPISGFMGTLNWPFIFGLLAILVLTGIFLISNDRVMSIFGREEWWKLQCSGVRLAFALIVLHVFVMKWNGWIKWYQAGGERELKHPEWPGPGLLVGWFMAFVILIRTAEFIGPKFGKAMWYISTIALPLIYIVTFWWGRQFIAK